MSTTRSPPVAGRHEVVLHLRQSARSGENGQARIVGHRGARREQVDILAPQLRVVACGGCHEVRLRRGFQDHPPDRRVVERRIEVVHVAGAEIAERRSGMMTRTGGPSFATVSSIRP